MRSVAALIALAVAASLVACGGAASDAASPEIVFTVNNEGWTEIWVMDADGNARRRLTAAPPAETDAAGNAQPSWSPNGARIAYTSTGRASREDEDDYELYVMDADGQGSTRLTQNRYLDMEPTWSPDGDRIAFIRAIGWGTEAMRMGLYTIGADGSDETPVFQPPRRPGKAVFVGAPAWSPRGDEIAFSLTTLGSAGPEAGPLYVIGADGGDLRRVVDAGSQPAWSPNGERLVFASMRDRFGRTCFHECGTAPEIYVVDANGIGLRRLTQTEAADQSPTWSPDGSRILFVSDRSSPADHRYELYVMEADGSSVERLSPPSADSWELEPDWRRGSYSR